MNEHGSLHHPRDNILHSMQRVYGHRMTATSSGHHQETT